MFSQVIDIIKENFSEKWLTESQRSVLEKLETARGAGRGTILNVYGRHGVGKTFLGWILSKRWSCAYCQSLEEIPARDEFAIVDNFESSREFCRRSLNRLKMTSIRQIVALSNERIHDDVWSIELCLTEHDLKIARANLFRHDLIPKGDKFADLWELVNACEVMR